MQNTRVNYNSVYDLTFNEQVITEFPSVTGELPSWLVFSFFLYLTGLLGILLNQRNFLVTMMAIEVMYLGAITSFVLYGVICRDIRGLIFGLLLLILAACESAIGLGILIVLYRFGRTVDFTSYQNLGG